MTLPFCRTDIERFTAEAQCTLAGNMQIALYAQLCGRGQILALQHREQPHLVINGANQDRIARLRSDDAAHGATAVPAAAFAFHHQAAILKAVSDLCGELPAGDRRHQQLVINIRHNESP